MQKSHQRRVRYHDECVRTRAGDRREGSVQLVRTAQSHDVQVSSVPSSPGFGTELLIYLITFGVPILITIWLLPRPHDCRRHFHL